MTSTRDEILQTIRESLSHGNVDVPLPEVPDVWKVQGISTDDLCETYMNNLEAVAGKGFLCVDLDEAVARIAETMTTLDADGAFQLGVMNREPAKEAGEKIRQSGRLSVETIHAPTNPNEADPRELKRFNASIVRAEYLLADTGSAVVRAPSAFDRLLCYLSPACFVIAKKSQLREHLPHAWRELKGDSGIAGATSGEFLVVTGPSRTADIEKVLILGVHGPKLLNVFILANE